jgi:chorismate mutase
LIFLSRCGEICADFGGVGVMKLWMRERDQLIEQTKAFVEAVAATGPISVAAAAPAVAEPAKSAEPVKKIEFRSLATALPVTSERAEIERRVAKFKAQQQKFQRDREASYHEIFSKTRAPDGNAARA